MNPYVANIKSFWSLWRRIFNSISRTSAAQKSTDDVDFKSLPLSHRDLTLVLTAPFWGVQGEGVTGEP